MLWQVEVEGAKSASQANLSEYIFVFARQEKGRVKRQKITLGRSFETNGRLRSRVLVIGRAAVVVTGRWLVSSDERAEMAQPSLGRRKLWARIIEVLSPSGWSFESWDRWWRRF
jgi:hypothetical protein